MALRNSCPTRCSRLHTVEVVAARRVRSAKQIAVSRTLVAKKGHESQVASLAGEICKWTQTEAQVSGKGIVAFDCVRDGWDANTFHFWERYEDTSSFGAHTAASRMVELLEQLQPHLEGPIGVSLYSYENGRIGPASIHAGPKGEGGLDDATGASGAAGGASYKQTSRAFDLTKVNEHEEVAREQELLASMSVDGGPAAAQQQPAAAATGGAAAVAGGSAADSRAGAGADDESEGRKGPLQQMWSMAVGVKDKVLGPLCRLLGHAKN